MVDTPVKFLGWNRNPDRCYRWGLFFNEFSVRSARMQHRVIGLKPARIEGGDGDLVPHAPNNSANIGDSQSQGEVMMR